VSAQPAESSLTFSLSGGETLSHSFRVSGGDILKMTYQVTLSNATDCVEVSGAFEQDYAPLRSIDYNQTSALSSKTFNGVHSFPINVTGTQTMTYSMCPNVPKCQGTAMFSATYETAVTVSPKTDEWSQIEVDLITVALVASLAIGSYAIYRKVRALLSSGSGALTPAPTRQGVLQLLFHSMIASIASWFPSIVGVLGAE